jgi:hypothetical protein
VHRIGQELASLDAISRKLALPEPDTSENQIESKPAFEALRANISETVLVLLINEQ